MLLHVSIFVFNRIAALRKWREVSGSVATYRNLIESSISAYKREWVSFVIQCLVGKFDMGIQITFNVLCGMHN